MAVVGCNSCGPHTQAQPIDPSYSRLIVFVSMEIALKSPNRHPTFHHFILMSSSVPKELIFPIYLRYSFLLFSIYKKIGILPIDPKQD